MVETAEDMKKLRQYHPMYRALSEQRIFTHDPLLLDLSLTAGVVGVCRFVDKRS